MYSKLDNRSNDSQDASGETDVVQLQETIVSPPTAVMHTETVTPSTGPPLVPSVSLKIQPLVGPKHTTVECPFCHHCVRTTTDTTTTVRTHNLALKCCIFCCCCLPYCMNSAKNIDHFCPSCKRYLGTYEK